MTTLDHQAVDVIYEHLESVRARRWTLRVLAGLAAVAALCLAALGVCAAAGGYWRDQPPAMLRWALLSGLCVTAAASVGYFLVRSLLWRQNPAQTARFIEQAIPELRNDLINSVLLAADGEQPNPDMVEMAIGEALARSRSVELHRCISTRPLKRWTTAAASVLLVVTAFASLQFGPFKRGLIAVLSPHAYVPTINRIELLSLEPGDTSRFAGGALTITAKIRNDAGASLPAEVLIEGIDQGRAMLASQANTTFSCPINVVDQSFRYAVRIGDSRWPSDKPYYSVHVTQKVEVKGLDLIYEFPRYTGLKSPLMRQNTDGLIEAPIGSLATVSLRVSAPLGGAAIEVMGKAAAAMTPSGDSLRFSGIVPVNADGGYRILLLDDHGKTLGQLPDLANGHAAADGTSKAGQNLMKGYFAIRAIPDDPPKIEFIAPGRDITAAPLSKVTLKIRAFDRYGLTDLKLQAGVHGQQPATMAAGQKFPPVKLVKPDGSAVRDVTFEYALDLSPYKKGDVVEYAATATDNRDLGSAGGPQTTRSETYKITVQDAAEVAADKAKHYEELRRRLMAILRLQEQHRVNAEICLTRHHEMASQPSAPAKLAKEIASLAQEVSAGQNAIKADLVDLVEKFPFDEDTGPLQGEIATLSNNDASAAVEQAKTMAAMDLKENLAHQGRLLSVTQDRIINSLQTLLAIMPSMANKKNPADKPASRPTDLTPEAKEKISALKDDLEKFMADQKKIIQASERLSKKPADNFTAEDEKILQDLKANEDKWEKFINEAFADFSKLAQQDFSNPMMLKELMAVKTDVTMAKDALSKKAAEIATALEQNGIENAQELTANLEKWLPDKPDREKWAMEDPAGQDNIEQADLPKELEDLVGDLLEEEEDLFDEMQDLTGKYAMSGDKGIGWDATDGPISSMNAQGVTGNQLPNSNEMSGRSGEGRQGKSTGEFVGDTATGKGGRRTPTRLTPEPFQKGEVKDTSAEAEGGATGGGKISAAGSDGLEGPVPPPLQKEMKRMAGKQAALMNKAERISGKFQHSDSANIRLLESITLMNRVQHDMENFRFRNVLREREETLSALKQSKLLLSGQIDVSADISAGMPKYIMDDISDAMKGKLPEEYRDVLQQYYKRLSEQGPK